MRFAGKIGFGTTVETSPGILEERVETVRYRGDVTTHARRFSTGETINGEVQSGAVVSVLADKRLLEEPFSVRFVEYGGVRWQVSYVEVKRPRVNLTLTDKYNG